MWIFGCGGHFQFAVWLKGVPPPPAQYGSLSGSLMLLSFWIKQPWIYLSVDFRGHVAEKPWNTKDDAEGLRDLPVLCKDLGTTHGQVCDLSEFTLLCHSARSPTIGSCHLCTKLGRREPVSPTQHLHAVRPRRCRPQPLFQASRLLAVWELRVRSSDVTTPRWAGPRAAQGLLPVVGCEGPCKVALYLACRTAARLPWEEVSMRRVTVSCVFMRFQDF